MKRDFVDYVSDILESINDVQEFTEGVAFEEFLKDVRDLLIHSYDKTDMDEVWDTVQNDLLPLVSALEKIIPLEKKKLGCLN